MKLSPIKLISTKVFFNRKNQKRQIENWQQQLISLYIVRNTDGICLFSHHFNIGLTSQIESQLVGMGFAAVIRMMKEIVNTSAELSLIDLGKNQVLIEEKKDYFAILVATNNSFFLREKLKKLADYFEKIFELQLQINNNTCVCLEDYALTSDLISLVFDEESDQDLGIVPIIFKSIRKKYHIFSRNDNKFPNLRPLNKFVVSNNDNIRQKEKNLFEFLHLRPKY
ncbi:MAG: hypothetical protein ACFFAJ_13895 [Candidatus Hodarchaeota archaeon]